MRHLVLGFVTFLAMQCLADDPPKSRSTLFAQDVGIVLSDAGMFFTAPLRFSPGEWMAVGGFVGGTTLLMATDQGLYDGIRREGGSTLNNDFWDIPTRYGTALYANIAGVTLYATGLIAGSDDIRITGRLLFESLAFSGVSVIMARYVFGRSRPFSNRGPWAFNWFEFSNGSQSFPSGHTTVAFALSTVFAERINTLWARIAFYGLATLTGYARVRNNQHWVSDVVAGAAFGFAGGYFVVARQNEREETSDGPTIGGRLSLQPTGQGLRLTYWLR